MTQSNLHKIDKIGEDKEFSSQWFHSTTCAALNHPLRHELPEINWIDLRYKVPYCGVKPSELGEAPRIQVAKGGAEWKRRFGHRK